MVNNKEEHRIPVKKMIFNGKGQVTVNPDLTVIRLGVLTAGESVTAAQAENARISQQILDALKKFANIELKTYQYQIEKVYDYENGNRIDRGYSVRNIYEIRTGNVGQTGIIIDTAVYNGANTVELVSFDVASPEKYYQQALKSAVSNAYDKAKIVSTGLKIMFDPVPILITENSTQPIPFTPMFAAREGTYATPVESGSKLIEASVTVEFAF
jgi:uncharacterized protein